MTKILVPYDGSTPSENAVKQAIEFASSSSGSNEIILLNVIPELLLPPIMLGSPQFRSRITGDEITATELVKEVSQLMKEPAQKMLNEIRQRLLIQTKDNTEIRTKVIIGHASDKIIEFAKEENVDLIVIGNVGLSGASKFRSLGSVSRNVSERSACPVMIVH